MTNNNAKLYFYGDETLIQTLKSGYLPLSDNWNFLKPYYDFSRWENTRVTSLSESEFEVELQREYDSLPDVVRLMLTFEDFLIKKEELRPAITTRVLAERQPSEQGYSADRLTKVWNMRLFDAAVCPFAWEQLAGHHGGFCAAIDSQSAMFESGSSLPALLKPVVYGDGHDVSRRSNNPLPGALADVAEHSSNGEWRALFPKTSFEQSRIKVASGQVRELYVGALASDSTRQSLTNLVQLDLRFRSTQLYEVLPDASKWRLTSRKVSS